MLVAIEEGGVGQDAVGRAGKDAKERKVFGRHIGQNQGIQHPLAENFAQLEAAYWQCILAAWQYDAGRPCGTAANVAKFLSARAAFDSCTRAVLTHGGIDRKSTRLNSSH